MDTNFEEEGTGNSSLVFEELKPLCIRLFSLLDSSRRNDPQPLFALTSFIREASSGRLQPYLDYILVPLLLLLDSSIACRSSTGRQQDNMPLKVSDSIAEAVLFCLEQLLQQCNLTTVEQMSMLLRKLTLGASLSPSEASEEFRHGIVKCLRSLLLGLKPCSDELCTCKYNSLQAISLRSSENYHKPQESVTNQLHKEISGSTCLISFLCSEAASAAVGHLLSLFLQIAEAEAERGHKGSGNLRTDVLETLRVLMYKMGTADALAYFLPGVVSGLARALRHSKSKSGSLIHVTSGAAARAGALEQAVRGLGEVLIIAFGDQENASYLVDDVEYFHQYSCGSPESALESLRCLSRSMNGGKSIQPSNTVGDEFHHGGIENKKDEICSNGMHFRIQRSKEWLNDTANHVNRILSATFPSLCTHPSGAVRLALADVAGTLLIKCNLTLQKSKVLLLECLLALFFDELQSVSVSAHDFLVVVFSIGKRCPKDNLLNGLFNRLIDKLPSMLLKGDEASKLLNVKRLLAAMYFSGPEGVRFHIFNSPTNIGNFMELMKHCMGYNAIFTGSIEQIAYHYSASSGYLPAILELNTEKAGERSNQDHWKPPKQVFDFTNMKNTVSEPNQLLTKVIPDISLPRMPPWFVQSGNQKFYDCVSTILRLSALSSIYGMLFDKFLSVIVYCLLPIRIYLEFCLNNSGHLDDLSLSILIEIPLEILRQIIFDLRTKAEKENWYDWYVRNSSGQTLRDAATAVCILNEIIYGAANRLSLKYVHSFRSVKNLHGENVQRIIPLLGKNLFGPDNEIMERLELPSQKWEIDISTDSYQHIADCVSNILHEYHSFEIWTLPVDFRSLILQQHVDSQQVPWHFFQDTSTLQQVILEGIGVFGISLGKYFEANGFLYSTLYLLLEKLSSACYNISSAADIALRMFATSCGFLTVKDLLVANADYVMDMLCRQLRHVTLYPHAPTVLATVLSCFGAVHDVLALLEEPMHSISLELDLLTRQHHPHLTVPLLMAISEIVKALGLEAHSVRRQSLESKMPILSEADKLKAQSQNHEGRTASECNKEQMGERVPELEHWEHILMSLNDRKKCCLSIGKITESCLAVAIPLMGSKEQEASQISLDIVERGISTLAMIEEALRHEKESIEAIEWISEKLAFGNLQDSLNSIDSTVDTNKVLPAMNKIWPYFVACLKHPKPQVVIKCMYVIGNVVMVCGGDFFIRRFKAAACHFLKLLSLGSCTKRSAFEGEKPLMLPYRKGIETTVQMDAAEGSILKVKEAFFRMLVTIAGNKKSASAIDSVFTEFAAVTVGFACGSPMLHDVATNALFALSNIDADLVWLLVADVAYSSGKGHPNPPDPSLPKITDILPPPQSSKYLWVQYTRDNFDLISDIVIATQLLEKLNP